jgi:hypothetical protein
MLAGTRAPPKPEQPDDDAGRSDHRAVKAVLGNNVRSPLSNGLTMMLLVEGSIDEDACCDAEDDADTD